MEVHASASNESVDHPTPSLGPQVEVASQAGVPLSQPLSKNAQKKLAKAAQNAALKKERRAAEKARRKERKRIEAEKRAAGELEEDADNTGSRKRRKLERREPFGARVVVDLGFDEMMMDQEVKSLVSQLAYTYSANRRAAQPFSSLLFTSLNGRTHARLESLSDAAYKRWVGSEFWTEDYERLWKASTQNVDDQAGKARGKTTLNPIVPAQDFVSHSDELEDASSQTRRSLSDPQTAPKESVVYLTADSEEELTELKEGETYIIGGIVDHNRYKNLCLRKSQEAGIRSACLPIGTYLAELKTRKVLTVNQTFDILLRWVETHDWEKALWEVIPKRKFQEKGKDSKGGGHVENEGDENEDDIATAAELVVDANALGDTWEDAEVGDSLYELPDADRLAMVREPFIRLV